MLVKMLSDTVWDSGVEEASCVIFNREEWEEPRGKDWYGPSLSELGIVLMCRHPHLHFKQRMRFQHKERKMHLDVMLDYDVMKSLSHRERMRLISQRLIDEIPQALAKYALKEFDLPRFVADWKHHFERFL